MPFGNPFLISWTRTGNGEVFKKFLLEIWSSAYLKLSDQVYLWSWWGEINWTTPQFPHDVLDDISHHLWGGGWRHRSTQWLNQDCNWWMDVATTKVNQSLISFKCYPAGCWRWRLVKVKQSQMITFSSNQFSLCDKILTKSSDVGVVDRWSLPQPKTWPKGKKCRKVDFVPSRSSSTNKYMLLNGTNGKNQQRNPTVLT